MSKFKSNQAGFTLIELLIWITLVVIIMAALSGVFSTYTRVWALKNQQYDVHQSARLVLGPMINEMRYGRDFRAPAVIINADQNEAITFTSHKDFTAPGVNTIFTYYIDRNDRRLYRLRNENIGTLELAPGQMNGMQNIRFGSPAGQQVFTRIGASVNIAIQITDGNQNNQSALVRTTVSDIAEFLR